MIRPTNKIPQQPNEDSVLRSSEFSISGRAPLTIRRRPTFGLFLLILLVTVAQSGAAQGVKFTAPVTYPAGAPYVVTAGDFNGDRKIDLVAGDIMNKNLLVLLGNGDGTLKPAVTYHLSTSPRFLLANDFNRDGKLDVVFGDSSPANIGVLLGKGDGSFDPPISNAVAGWHILAADFNNDGKPDLVTAVGNSLAVLLNNGNGTFQNPKTYPVPLAILAVFASADINGDGKTDLVAVSRNSTIDWARIVTVMLGNGDGKFQLPINTSGNWGQGSGPYSIVVGDFDRDRKADVVVTDEFFAVLVGVGNDYY